MLSEMILNLTERTTERFALVAGGGVASLFSWIKMDMPRILLAMTFHEWVDFLLTVTIGSAVGWGIHFALNSIKKACKKHYSKNKKT